MYTNKVGILWLYKHGEYIGASIKNSLWSIYASSAWETAEASQTSEFHKVNVSKK